MSELRDLQVSFAKAVPRLLDKAFELGFTVTLGDCYRSPEECERIGHQSSCHGIRLAVDLNLFKDGRYLTDTADHEPLGLWWKEQHDAASWGGNWGDGNHYSFEYEGRR